MTVRIVDVTMIYLTAIIKGDVTKEKWTQCQQVTVNTGVKGEKARLYMTCWCQLTTTLCLCHYERIIGSWTAPRGNTIMVSIIRRLGTMIERGDIRCRGWSPALTRSDAHGPILSAAPQSSVAALKDVMVFGLEQLHDALHFRQPCSRLPR